VSRIGPTAENPFDFAVQFRETTTVPRLRLKLKRARDPEAGDVRGPDSSPRLSRPARLLIAGSSVAALGTGLILPLTLIYLHQVRGIGLPLVGLLLTMSAVVGLIAVPLAGLLLDRFSTQVVLAIVTAGQAIGEGSLAWSHSPLTAIPPLLLIGACSGSTFPASNTMMAVINPDPARQQRAFAVNFTGINAGVGIGGAIGAAVADVHHPGSFQALFLGNGIICLAVAILYSRLHATRPVRDARREPEPGPVAGYREVLGNPGLRVAMLAMLVLALTGYAALDAGLPAYATVVARVPVRVVALSLTVNTAVIVGAQMFMLRLVRLMRRSHAMAAIGLIWAVAWTLFGLSALPSAPGLRIAGVLAFAGLFALGETFMAPTMSPLVNSLASERVRGRANALSSSAYSIAFVISPAICTSLIAAGLAALWIAMLSAGCLSIVLLASLLASRLTTAQNRVASPATEPAQVPAQARAPAPA
jgi:MFS family permease